MSLRPISLRVENFASYIEETFDFKNAPDLFSVIGSNGAGKSTFFVDAFLTVLYNRARCTNKQGTGLENLISSGKDKLEVELIFEHNNSEIKVIRRRFAKGGQELELYIDGYDHTDKVKETQAKLDSIIKVDYETFLDTICIGQGKSGNFMEKPPNERKECFTQVLNLDKYDILQEYTTELRKEVKSLIKEKEEKLEEIQSEVKYKDQYNDEILEGKKEIKRLESEILIKDAALEKELLEKALYESKVKERNEILKKQQNLQNQVNTLKNNISNGHVAKENCENIIQTKEKVLKDLEEKLINLEHAREKYNNLTASKSSLEATNTMLTNQAKELKMKYDRLKDFNEADCGFCGQEITEEHKQSHLNDMQTEAKKYLLTIKENQVVINNLNNEMQELTSESRELKNEIQLLQNKKSEIEQSEIKLSNIVSRISELTEDLKRYEEELNEVLAIKVEELENKIFNDLTLRSELSNLRNQQTNWKNKVAVAQNELTKLDKYESLIIDLESEIKELRIEFDLLDNLHTAWGKDGIQAIIIDNALPDIQDEINNFLSILTDDKVSIEFITQKEKGKGKKATSIETLDIMINDGENSRVYETYSGGERFRVDFACHVGLAKFLSKRSGAPVDFFIIDEGIGSQDEVAKEHFVTSVNKLTTIFNKVIVITHIPDIIESFHHKVEVFKHPTEGSKIKLIS